MMHVVEHRADDPDAPVVVLVHGVFDSMASFDGVVAELAPEHTVVTYDRRGWGGSRDLRPAMALADHADDLLMVVGERRATVVGHSYGGVVGLLAATRRPELVASLAVFEPTVAWTDWWPDLETMNGQGAEFRDMLREGSEYLPRPTSAERAANRESVARDLSLVQRQPFAFADVTVPRLVGGSTNTTPWDFQTGARLATILDAELVVFDGAGHPAHRTHPQEFADFARRAVALGR
jgi:pimeloyl-ACP methyl ester carboxylesterase